MGMLYLFLPGEILGVVEEPCDRYFAATLSMPALGPKAKMIRSFRSHQSMTVSSPLIRLCGS